MARKIGSKNARTKAWEKLGDFMLHKGAKRILTIASNMEDDEFVDFYLKLVQYFRPKYSNTTIKGESTVNINVVAEQDIIDKI